MKSTIFAAAAVAAVASAHEARAPIDLNVAVPGLLSVKVCLGLDIKLPLGISIESDGCPSGPPSEDRTNVWHPPHPVPMDGCGDNGNEEWHYVQPCDCEAPAPHTWGVTTVTQEQVSTVISCAPTVTDCPGNGAGVTTVAVPATTYICPLPVTSTTLNTVPATSTSTSTSTASETEPASTQSVDTPTASTPSASTQPSNTPSASIPSVNTQSQSAGTQSASTPTINTPSVNTQPSNTPGASQPTNTTPCSESTGSVVGSTPATTPAVVVPTITTPASGITRSIITVPPFSTGHVTPSNGTYPPPPLTAGASQSGQKIGAVVAMGLAAALLI